MLASSISTPVNALRAPGLRQKADSHVNQAYLETDPSARGQPETYTARYKTFACSQVEAAIAEYDKLSKDLGEALFLGAGQEGHAPSTIGDDRIGGRDA